MVGRRNATTTGSRDLSKGNTPNALTSILEPMRPHRAQMVVLSGLSNSGVVSPKEGGGVHTRAHGGWLNGVLPKGPTCGPERRSISTRRTSLGLRPRSARSS